MLAKGRIWPGSFTFRGQRYRYLLHSYNETWTNERAVEVPLAVALLDARRDARVLEVGNVLSHYGHTGHEVVDKFEAAPGVRNADVLEADFYAAYDLIVSISTLEHVGLDEEEKDPDKPRRAVERLNSLLAPGGTLFVTVPLGYNAGLDDALTGGRIPFDEVGYLRRVSRLNRWGQASAGQVAGSAYGAPYPAANALAIGVTTQRK